MIDNDDKYLSLLKNIVLSNIPLDKYNVFLFGSRVRAKHKFAADYDIGVKGNEPLSLNTISKIKDIIEESMIPFDVDIIDFSNVSDSFKKVALKEYKTWNEVKSIKVN